MSRYKSTNTKVCETCLKEVAEEVFESSDDVVLENQHDLLTDRVAYLGETGAKELLVKLGVWLNGDSKELRKLMETNA